MKELIEAEEILWKIRFRNDTDYGKQGWFFEEDYGDLYNAVLLTIRAIQNLESTIVGGKQ